MLMEILRSQKEAPELIIMSVLGSPCIIKESLAKGVFSFMKEPLQTYKLFYAINGGRRDSQNKRSGKIAS